jgi:hypothetical protein
VEYLITLNQPSKTVDRKGKLDDKTTNSNNGGLCIVDADLVARFGPSATDEVKRWL